MLSFAITLSYNIRIYRAHKHPFVAMIFSKFSPWIAMVTMAHVSSLYLLNQYNPNRLTNLGRSAMSVVLSGFLAGLVIACVFFFLPKYVFGRQVLLLHLAVVSLSLVFWRSFWIKVLSERGSLKHLAALGDAQTISAFVAEFALISNSGFTLNSVCVSNGSSGVAGAIPEGVEQYTDVVDSLKSSDFDILVFDSTNGFFQIMGFEGSWKSNIRERRSTILPLFTIVSPARSR